MSKKNLCAVIIDNGDEKYKVHTIVLSKDGSLHFIAGFNEHFKNIGEEYSIPSKGTYHRSGVKHFTSVQGESRDEVFRKVGTAHKDITESEGLLNFTIKNVKKNSVELLDQFKKYSKYQHVIELDSSNYTNLTLQYFLAAKDFDISRSAHLYKEVFEIPFDDKKIILGTHDSSNTDELLRVLLNR